MPRTQTICLVDDDPNVLALLQAALRLKGYRVVSRKDPVSALRYLRGHVPDLLVVGTDLPDLDGFDFIRRVQGSTRSAYAPFILIGDETEPEKAAMALRMGAREFLRKPFAVEELLVRVDKVFQDVERSRTASPRSDLEGRLDKISFVHLVRFLGALETTGRLHISVPSAPVEGVLLLQNGEVVHAVFGRLKGRAALLQLMIDQEGTFAFSAEVAPEGLAVTVDAPAQEIFEDGLRMVDRGLLRRIDVLNRVACRTFVRLMEVADEESVILLTERIAPVMELQQTDEDAAEMFEEASELSEVGDDERDDPSMERFSSSDSLVLEAEEWEASESSILAPVSALYSTSDRLSISGDIPALEFDEGATQSIIVRSYRPVMEEEEEPRSEDTVSEVALVDSGPGPLEQTFLVLKTGFAEEAASLRVVDFQISTHSGRSLASTVTSQRRREMIAAFTGQAIQFADRTDEAMVAQLAAGDLQLLVMELPRKRLLTCLFDVPPDVEIVRGTVQELLQSVT